MTACLDRHPRMSCARFGVAGRFNHNVKRKGEDNTQIFCRNEFSGIPGGFGFFRRVAQSDLVRRDADIGQAARSSCRFDINSNARVHQRHFLTLRNKAASETTAADDAGFNRMFCRGKIIKMVHTSARPVSVGGHDYFFGRIEFKIACNRIRFFAVSTLIIALCQRIPCNHDASKENKHVRNLPWQS